VRKYILFYLNTEYINFDFLLYWYFYYRRNRVSSLFGSNEGDKDSSYNTNSNYKSNNNIRFINQNQYENEPYERINEHFNQIFKEIGNK